MYICRDCTEYVLPLFQLHIACRYVQPLVFGLNVKGGTLCTIQPCNLWYSKVWFGNLLSLSVAISLSVANFIGEIFRLILKYHYHPLACPFHLNIEAGQRFCVLTPYPVLRTSYIIDPKRIAWRLGIYYIYSRFLYPLGLTPSIAHRDPQSMMVHLSKLG